MSAGPPEALPLRVVYSVGELATAARMDRRKLLRILEKAGVQVLHVSRLRLIPLSELEQKARPLWDSIQAAEMLRHVLDGS